MESTKITVICKIFIILRKSRNSYFVLNSSLTWINPGEFLSFFAVLSLHSNVNSSHTSIVFLILNSWETDLQKSIDFLLNPFFIFRNDMYMNLFYYIIQYINSRGNNNNKVNERKSEYCEKE